MANKARKKGIEHQLGDLQALVAHMEEGEMTLEETLAAFEKGIKLTREAQAQLAAAEQRVQTLIEENGKPVATEFHEEDDS